MMPRDNARHGRGRLRQSEMLTAADEVDDLDLIPFVDLCRIEQRALQDDEIPFDGNSPAVDVEPLQQVGDRQGSGDVERVAVQNNLQILPEGLPPLGLPTRSLARRVAGALRSRGSLARSLAASVDGI